MDLESVGPLMMYIQMLIEQLVKKHFKFTLTAEEILAWPLHELKSKYLPLMLMSQSIADGSQYGWRNFFTSPDSRSALVSGIIGEFLKQRIFNHTCFGLSPRQMEELEDMDREFIHHDAFVRTKKRAMIIKKFMAGGLLDVDAPLPKAAKKDLGQEQAMAKELMAVLMPLMPPPIFSFNAESESFEEGPTRSSAWESMQGQLCAIMEHAVVLHRHIRLLGEDGTIVRIAPAMLKGERVFRGSPCIIVNERMVNATKSQGLKKGQSEDQGKLKVKMTCFGRVEAYVPHGPDFEQLKDHEAKLRLRMQEECAETGKEYDPNEFEWDRYAAEIWPELPRGIDREPAEKYGIPVVQTSGNGVETVNHHGSYVTIHSRLTPHQVYCEWEPLEDRTTPKRTAASYASSPRRATDGIPVPIPLEHRQTLAEAVEEARLRESPLKHRGEDFARDAWNFACRHEAAFETGLVSFAALRWFYTPAEMLGVVSAGVGRVLGRRGREVWEKGVEVAKEGFRDGFQEGKGWVEGLTGMRASWRGKRRELSGS
jgi:hypothetical protein